MKSVTSHRPAKTSKNDTLRRCGYAVEAMEKYPARDDRPRSACEADAAKCDIYIGIFAWMYGFVPPEDNLEGKSITQLEYLAAGRAQKSRLIFLLADDAPWPSSLRDAEQKEDAGKRIRDLRNRLKAERWTGFFKSPDDLANSAAIRSSPQAGLLWVISTISFCRLAGRRGLPCGLDFQRQRS